MLLDRSAACITRCILLAGRLTIAVKPITLENLLVIEDGIYTRLISNVHQLNWILAWKIHDLSFPATSSVLTRNRFDWILRFCKG